MDFQKLSENLTDEQKAKAMACKSLDEVLAFAKKEGIPLSEEQLEALSGGDCYQDCEKGPC